MAFLRGTLRHSHISIDQGAARVAIVDLANCLLAGEGQFALAWLLKHPLLQNTQVHVVTGVPSPCPVPQRRWLDHLKNANPELVLHEIPLRAGNAKERPENDGRIRYLMHLGRRSVRCQEILLLSGDGRAFEIETQKAIQSGKTVQVLSWRAALSRKLISAASKVTYLDDLFLVA